MIKKFIRSLLLIIILFCALLSPLQGLGLGFQADLGYAGIADSRSPVDNISASLGFDIGFLTPYFIDAVLSLGIGSVNNRTAFKTALTIHYTAMLTKIFGIYTGVGAGIDVNWGVRFSPLRNPFEANHTGLITKALFPLGVKFFLKTSFEFFAEVNFGIGLYNSWVKNYTSSPPSPQNISSDMYQRDFYWDVSGRFGIRYWY